MSARPVANLHSGLVAEDVVGWLDGVAEPIFVLQKGVPEPVLVHANRALCQAVGLSRERLRAQGLRAWLADEGLKRLYRAVDSALATGRSRCRELDPAGAIAELRRIREHGHEFCLATLRLPASSSAVPLSRDELRHRADLLTTAMDLEAMVAWTWDRKTDEICLEYRAAAVEFLPFDATVLTEFYRQVHEGDRERVQNAVREALNSTGVHQVELRIVSADGAVRWLSSAFKRFLDDRGQPAGLVGASRDITARKDVFRELAESEERLRTVLENEPECVKVVDASGILRMVNPAGLAMIEADELAQVFGHDVRELIAPEHHEAFEAFHQRVMAGRTESLEFEIIGLKGARRWMDSRAAPLRDASGRIVGQLAVTRDVTDRRQLEQQIIDAASREQERIGRDLHDGLGQDLTGISLMLKGLLGQLDRPQPELRRDLDGILQLVNQALQSARSLSRGLSPVALERGGLIEALRELAARSRDKGKRQVRFANRLPAGRQLDTTVALHLYRIAQEALSNAQRHSSATRVTVTLAEAGGAVRLRIADNGTGLAPPAGGQEGLGLRTMEFRSRLIGAVLEIGRSASGGTAVTVTLPASGVRNEPP